MIVALYARVSTTKQAEKDLSIPDQLRQMHDWCQRHGHSIASEYIEAGASATDDRRPEFQRMITEACATPKNVDAIVVHSQSRFFRDMVNFALYERRLNKAGVKIISITQPTGEEVSGEMMRRIISLFDEYQSRENSKHTLRAMNENARRGFFNGSMPPFGYKLEEVDVPGNKGKKRQLALDETEGVIVHKIVDLYLDGDGGRTLGMLGVAKTLNRLNISFRGRKWTKKKIDAILRDRTYVGEHYFNKKDRKTNRLKPKEEWVLCPTPSIIERHFFDAVQQRRHDQHPSQIPAGVLSSPNFLTGILKCETCGGNMIIATAKSGRYRYYKCRTQIQKGGGCNGRSVPVKQLDTLVRQSLGERVFIPERVQTMVAELRARLNVNQGGGSEQLKKLRRELEQNKAGSERLFDAVEKGLLPMDGLLSKRAHATQARRQDILLEIANLERQRQLPNKLFSSLNVQAFCRALKEQMLDEQSGFGKAYLKLLVTDIRLMERKIVIRGGYGSLGRALARQKLDTSVEVPSLGYSWLPGRDSNPRPGD